MKAMRLFAAVAVVAVLFTLPVTAQTISSKPFVERQGTYNEITGTTIVSGQYADDQSYNVNFGFNFEFNGITYNSVYATTNGYMTFGTSYPYAYWMPPLRSQTYGRYLNMLSPWGDDLHGNYQGSMMYEVTGSAPKRVLTIQWKDWMTYYNRGDKLNFQVKLYETSNMIDFVYGTQTPPTSNQNVNVGITSSYPGDRQVRTGSWVNSTYSTVGNAYQTYGPNDTPPVGYIYRFGCYVPDGMVDAQMTDAQGNPAGYYFTPGNVYVSYRVAYPLDQAYDVNITLNFYRVGDNSGNPAYTETFVVQKPIGELNGIRQVALNLPPSFYRVEVIFNMWNNCLIYEDVITETSTLLIAPGTQLCEVWPGDVNNDEIVNYGDRRDLNHYIFNANLRSSWLLGPARYKAEAAVDPLTYYVWELQPSIPWTTPEGCYMDADGNGIVNNFDYIAVKLNWMKVHGVVPAKNDGSASPESFGMDQNYPNPFNPSTSIEYSVPESSTVTLVVTDMLGRTVATLVDGIVEAGMYKATFDASTLGSGQYFAHVTMVAAESGLTFSKSIKMTLSK